MITELETYEMNLEHVRSDIKKGSAQKKKKSQRDIETNLKEQVERQNNAVLDYNSKYKIITCKSKLIQTNG